MICGLYAMVQKQQGQVTKMVWSRSDVEIEYLLDLFLYMMIAIYVSSLFTFLFRGSKICENSSLTWSLE